MIECRQVEGATYFWPEYFCTDCAEILMRGYERDAMNAAMLVFNHSAKCSKRIRKE